MPAPVTCSLHMKATKYLDHEKNESQKTNSHFYFQLNLVVDIKEKLNRIQSFEMHARSSRHIFDRAHFFYWLIIWINGQPLRIQTQSHKLLLLVQVPRDLPRASFPFMSKFAINFPICSKMICHHLAITLGILYKIDHVHDESFLVVSASLTVSCDLVSDLDV